MTAEQTISERIEAISLDVLGEHVFYPSRPDGTRPRCGGCEWRVDGPVGWEARNEHRTHVAKETAAALLAAGIMQEVRAEAQIAVLLEAAEEIQPGTTFQEHPKAFLMGKAHRLRDRADSIMQGRRDGGGMS